MDRPKSRRNRLTRAPSSCGFESRHAPEDYSLERQRRFENRGELAEEVRKIKRRQKAEREAQANKK